MFKFFKVPTSQKKEVQLVEAEIWPEIGLDIYENLIAMLDRKGISFLKKRVETRKFTQNLKEFPVYNRRLHIGVSSDRDFIQSGPFEFIVNSVGKYDRFSIYTNNQSKDVLNHLSELTGLPVTLVSKSQENLYKEFMSSFEDGETFYGMDLGRLLVDLGFRSVRNPLEDSNTMKFADYGWFIRRDVKILLNDLPLVMVPK